MRQSRFVIVVRPVKQEAGCKSLLTATNASYRSLFQRHLGLTGLGVKNERSNWGATGSPENRRIFTGGARLILDG